MECLLPAVAPQLSLTAGRLSAAGRRDDFASADGGDPLSENINRRAARMVGLRCRASVAYREIGLSGVHHAVHANDRERDIRVRRAPQTEPRTDQRLANALVVVTRSGFASASVGAARRRRQLRESGIRIFSNQAEHGRRRLMGFDEVVPEAMNRPSNLTPCTAGRCNTVPWCVRAPDVVSAAPRVNSNYRGFPPAV